MSRDDKIEELKGAIGRLQFVIDALSSIPSDSCSQAVHDAAQDAAEASWELDSCPSK